MKFKLYENNKQVAEAEKLEFDLNTNEEENKEDKKSFSLINVNTFHNFHFLNTDDNIYTIKFVSENASGVLCEYEVLGCIIEHRSTINEDLNHLKYIKGRFDKLLGTSFYDEQ